MLSSQENPIQIPSNYYEFKNNIPIPSLHFTTTLNNNMNIPMSYIPNPTHDFPQQSSSLSNNSTSDEADELQLTIIDERKQRRMISNRESARRSRMRKQKHLDELWSQVVRLRTENHNLLEKLNNLSDSLDKFVQENSQLKEETCNLRNLITELQIGNPFVGLGELQCCNSIHLKADSSNQSITSSIDLLQ